MIITFYNSEVYVVANPCYCVDRTDGELTWRGMYKSWERRKKECWALRTLGCDQGCFIAILVLTLFNACVWKCVTGFYTTVEKAVRLHTWYFQCICFQKYEILSMKLWLYDTFHYLTCSIVGATYFNVYHFYIFLFLFL